MWSQLPELILIRIFRHLNCDDRFNVGEVCQAWRVAVAAPTLWRSVTVLIDGDLSSGFSLATELTAKYGHHMKTLELAWSRPCLPPKDLQSSANQRAKEGLDFFAAVREREVQLTKIVLTNWYLGTNWNYRGKILYALTHFLRGQSNVEILSLLNSNIGVADVLKILRAITTSSAGTLRLLDLRGSFRDWQTPHTNSKYLRYLGRFHALTALHLDYPAVSTHCLNSLASGGAKSLRNLEISVRASDSRRHTIDDVAWRNVAHSCPQLSVSYSIVNISHFEEMSYLLQPSIPMAKFQLYSGHVWDQSRSRNFRATIGLLVTYYSKSLAEVVLQLRHNREEMDDLLISMLRKCPRLTNLRYDGIIRNLETIGEILQLQNERKTQFRTIHVKPRRVNTRNREILSEICYKYRPEMCKQGVDFRVQHPGSTIFYY